MYKLSLTDGTVLRVGVGTKDLITEYGDIFYLAPGERKDMVFAYPGYKYRDGKPTQTKWLKTWIEIKHYSQEQDSKRTWESASGILEEGGFEYQFGIRAGSAQDGEVSFTFFVDPSDLTLYGRMSEPDGFDYLGHGNINNLVDLSEDPGTGGNPYEPGGDSGPGVNPPGTFDDTSDPIPDSPLPTLSAANTGFTRIYNPTLAQVQDLAKYLWTDETVIQTIWNHIKQFFENPMEAIIGFNLVPVPVPDAGSKNFALMYIDTGVSMNVAANQFVDLDCGTVKLERYYGSAMDQSPYTKVSCFLPYIGMVTLNTDEVMGTTLQVLYRVDIVSGSCVAKILVDGNVLYQYSGHCAINIPISAADFSSYVSAAISVAKLAVGAAIGGVAGAITAGGADAAQATNNIVTHTTTETTTQRNPSTGRQITSGTRTTLETFEWPVESDSTRASYEGLTAANVTNTAAQVISSKPHIQHSGSFSGNTGYLGIRRPYLIIERPNMCLPSAYQTFNGFPAMITMTLSSCKGFTKVQQVQLTGMSATNPEQAEILMLLKSGVIF